MLSIFYHWLRSVTSKPEEKGQHSAGLWQDAIRTQALKLCQGAEGRLLEVGCGEGLFMSRLATSNKNIQIFGIDICKERLEKAEARFKEKGIKNVIISKADATSLPFQDSYFDIIVCINVIFNLKSIYIVKMALNEMARVCKKDGRIIVDFRNSQNFLLFIKYRFAYYYDKTVENLPLKTYSLKNMQLLLDEAGLKLTRQITIGFPMRQIAPLIILEIGK